MDGRSWEPSFSSLEWQVTDRPGGEAEMMYGAVDQQCRPPQGLMFSLISIQMDAYNISIDTKVKLLVAQSCLTLCDPMDYSLLLCPWDSPGKNTGVGSHSRLQGIFPTQELNSHLLHCRQILYHLSHQGSPFIDMGQYKYPCLSFKNFFIFIYFTVLSLSCDIQNLQLWHVESSSLTQD